MLSQANYKAFWSTLDSDDLYADLIADVNGFEELMRVRIAVCVGQSCREVERKVLEGWLSLQGAEFERFVSEICGWTLDGSGKGGMVIIPTNKENEAKGTVVRENVQFDRMSLVVFTCYLCISSFRTTIPQPSLRKISSQCSSLTNPLPTNPEFSRIIRRAYEQPA